VPDSTNHTWIDSTFIAPTDGIRDTTAQLRLVSADVIGMYSMPIIYRQVETTTEKINIMASYYQEFNTISGIKNIAAGYRAFEPPKIDGILISLAEFNAGDTTVSGFLNRPVVYTTGYNAISGTLDRRIVFTGGREMLEFVTVRSISQYAPPKYITKDYWVNYVDFSGNLTTSGTPIPFYYSDYSFITEYGKEFNDFYQGWRNNIVDISFAGWVGFPVYGDVYSSLLSINPGYRAEATTISGNVNIHYMDLFSTLLTTSGVECNVYCALTDYSYIQIIICR
jgi:hypothetical protein